VWVGCGGTVGRRNESKLGIKTTTIREPGHSKTIGDGSRTCALIAGHALRKKKGENHRTSHDQGKEE